jgi:hypothetical protein
VGGEEGRASSLPPHGPTSPDARRRSGVQSRCVLLLGPGSRFAAPGMWRVISRQRLTSRFVPSSHEGIVKVDTTQINMTVRETVLMLVSSLLNTAMATALSLSGSEMGRKWRDVLTRLYGLGPLDLFRHQGDYQLDLLLRALEAETLSQLRAGESAKPDIQMTLTRGWLLSTYELVRIAHETPKGKAHRPLTDLRRRLESVRVPIAKLKIANDSSMKKPVVFDAIGEGPLKSMSYSAKERPPFYPGQYCCSLSGSLGWYVYEPKSRSMVGITRRMLSDEMLRLWHDDGSQAANAS